MRALGKPSASTVASVMASGLFGSLFFASANQPANSRNGSSASGESPPVNQPGCSIGAASVIWSEYLKCSRAAFGKSPVGLYPVGLYIVEPERRAYVGTRIASERLQPWCRLSPPPAAPTSSTRHSPRPTPTWRRPGRSAGPTRQPPPPTPARPPQPHPPPRPPAPPPPPR